MVGAGGVVEVSDVLGRRKLPEAQGRDNGAPVAEIATGPPRHHTTDKVYPRLVVTVADRYLQLDHMQYG
jgi:hypothetical protein